MSKRYKVVGSLPLVIDGNHIEPGEEFEADLPADLEVYLLSAEHVRVLTVVPPAPSREED